MNSKRDICDRTFKFSVRAYKLYKELANPKINEIIIVELLRRKTRS